MRYRIILALLVLVALSGVLSGAVISPPRSGGGGGGASAYSDSFWWAIASGASASGDLTGWFDAGVISEVSMTSTASSCVNIQFFRKDTKLEADRVYWVVAADGQTATWYDLIGVAYRDDDATGELHYTLTNCGAASSTVTVAVRGIGQ